MEEEKLPDNYSQKNLPKNSKREFYFKKWGYKPKDFKKWGKIGGRPKKYVSSAERQKSYRRRTAQNKIDKGEIVGILNMTTGRINRKK